MKNNKKKNMDPKLRLYEQIRTRLQWRVGNRITENKGSWGSDSKRGWIEDK